MSIALLRDESVVRDIVGDASRAPSVHNVQPARWAFRREDGMVALLRDPARALPVADPTAHDERASLGAALEGFAIASSTRGCLVDGLRWDDDARRAFGRRSVGSFEIVAVFHLGPGAAADPLAPFVRRRRSWRGRFTNDAATGAALDTFRRSREAADARVLGSEAARALGRDIDDAMWSFERQPAYHAELWRWLRLDRRDPAYRRDGLTADALLLSEPERLASRLLLQPMVFRAFQVTGLGKLLLSERAATESAAGFICYCPPATMDAYAVGRGIHRLWLAATAAGLVLAPMSVLVDHAGARATIERQLALTPERRLALIFRAGKIDREPPESPRLPIDEMLIVL